METKMLYLIRGLPGSGKSTMAKAMSEAFGCVIWEADHYHMLDGEYQWRAETQGIAHKWCQGGVRECMELGHRNVIVSNTSTTEKELKPYLALAEEYGYAVTSIIVENRRGGKSVHNVPQETIDKMRARFSVKL